MSDTLSDSRMNHAKNGANVQYFGKVAIIFYDEALAGAKNFAPAKKIFYFLKISPTFASRFESKSQRKMYLFPQIFHPRKDGASPLPARIGMIFAERERERASRVV